MTTNAMARYTRGRGRMLLGAILVAAQTWPSRLCHFAERARRACALALGFALATPGLTAAQICSGPLTDIGNPLSFPGMTNCFNTTLFAQLEIDVPEDVCLCELGVRVEPGAVTLPDTILGVYDDAGPNGSPLNLQASTPSFPSVVGVSEISVVTPVVLPAGKYWLANNSNGQLSYGCDMGAGQIQPQFSDNVAFGPLPDPFPLPSSTSSMFFPPNFYARVVAGSICALPDGSGCTDPDDCRSGNCVDDVCCDTPCDEPLERCNLQGSEGVCTTVAAPVPAVSPMGILIGLLILLAVGGLGLRRARSASERP